MSKIPQKIINYFNQIDQGWNADGTKDTSRANNHVLDQQEVEYAKKKISIFMDPN